MKRFAGGVLVAAMLLILVIGQLFAQTDQYKFSRLDVNNGLSHNQVNCFLRDSKGFIWIGTSAGLNRYDGYNFKVFRNFAKDTSSIINNDIINLFEDPKGRVWAYTYFGTSIYDPITEKFMQNPNRLLKEFSIPDGLILNITKDSFGKFWFLHQAEGLFRYDPVKRESNHIASRDNHIVNSIGEDKDHNFWIIYRDGLFEKINGNTLEVEYSNDYFLKRYPNDSYDYNLRIDNDSDLWIFVGNQNRGVFYFENATQEIEHYSSSSSVFKLKSDIVKNIVIGDEGMIWVGTDHGGVNLLSKKNKTIQYLLNSETDDKSLSQNSINSLYRDYEGIFWIGTFKRGLNYYHENLIKFNHIHHQSGNPRSLPYDDINKFVEDDLGNLWIGTNGGGLLYYNRSNGSYKQYLHDPSDKNSLANNVIVTMYMDSEKKLWIGTYYGGLDCYDGKKFTHYKHSGDPTSISDDSVWEITEDSKGNLWIGTLVGGLNRFNKKDGTFTHFTSNDGIITGYVPALLEDSYGTLWVGTGFGISFLKKNAQRFEHYLGTDAPGSISNNSIISFLEDSRNLIWIGTQDGLNVYNRSENTYKVFRTQEGLPHNTILGILEDDYGNLWFSTPNGISNLTIDQDPLQKTFIPEFKNYDELDGLQGKFFNENGALKTREGELIFGGPNGFNIIHPSQIKFNTRKPPVEIIDFQVFNKSIGVGDVVNGKVLMDKSISEAEEITLKYNDNVFSIEFAALSFFHPEKNIYKYKLEPFNKEWLIADNNSRRVTYTNLDPGEYTFRVIAANSDGYWNEDGAKLSIVVMPPFWKTKIAFALYLFAIMGALFLTRWIALNRERIKFKLQQERAEAQKVHELDMLKIRFFTNVSHEFRTPLTLILTPLEKIIKQEKYADDKDHFNLIYRNAKRLLNLVNQLLDFRRMEVQEIKLNLSEGDIVKFVQEVVYSFSDMSEKKNIRFSFSSTMESFETVFDQNKIERILFNLVSNAFKFTPIGGSVKVEMRLQENNDTSQEIEIKVTDTGIGIPADKLDKVFDRFFQSDLPTSMVNQGSGIGLSITKEFVRIHRGKISVVSEPDKGSCFTVTIPVDKIASPIVQEEFIEELISMPSDGDKEEPQSKGGKKKPVILLVEDNDDFRFYLKDNLKQQYEILEATNGREGWQLAANYIPDMIVSDVMMPEMNGIDLCKKIKNDQRTSHIPVVLLTARAAEEQKVQGFEIGADDYVTKPFNFEILQSRIRNLIAQRAAFHKTLHKQIEVKGSEIKVSSLDEKLIENAIRIVEENISEADFSVEDLSHELGMSRVHLYKKLVSLTGKSPIEFIRTIRLQRAAQLLEQSQLTVAEVAYKVGFNNPKYFARYFKEQYTILPSLYASSKKQDSK